MPNTLVEVTGLRSMKRETLMTAMRLEALATAYVNGETMR